MTLSCIGCNAIEVESSASNTPIFVTATLPATVVPLPTQTLLPPSPIPTSQPIEGTTTTQINVRTETNTASDSLGVIPAFSKVSIIGKESSENWFQIIYLESSGWVRAEFVQTDVQAEIAIVEIEPSTSAGRSAVVKSGINVRNGPGIGFESIGVLTQKDVVWVLRKNSVGDWMQIRFKNEVGWVALEFLQIEGIENLPLAEVTQTAAENMPVVISETPIVFAQVAIDDFDTLQTPLRKISIEKNKLLQITGEVSAPQGDNEDWIEFSTSTHEVAIITSCDGDELQIELWRNGTVIEQFLRPCQNISFFSVSSNESYTLRVFLSKLSEPQYTHYILKLKVTK
jgi:uncharacterized protein YraI